MNVFVIPAIQVLFPILCIILALPWHKVVTVGGGTVGGGTVGGGTVGGGTVGGGTVRGGTVRGGTVGGGLQGGHEWTPTDRVVDSKLSTMGCLEKALKMDPKDNLAWYNRCVQDLKSRHNKKKNAIGSRGQPVR